MTKYRGRVDFRHGCEERIGIVLCNIGTPAAPTTAAVRRYLAEFLSDPRVVELPRWLWLPLLHGVILNIRPRRSAAAYRSIWTDHGAPLLVESQRLCRALGDNLGAHHGQRVLCTLGMRYGQPSIAEALDELIAAEARRLLIVPLYPQYAAATTASVHDAVFAHCQRLRWIPELRFVSHYHAAPLYIDALAQSVERHWQVHGRGARLLISFHGIPRASLDAGDPYYCQCQATARLLAVRLGLDDDAWQVSFQSRVGPATWLQPYTEQILRTWGSQQCGDIDVLCPGFAVDCLETLEEIAERDAHAYHTAGGGKLRYIAALNSSPPHVETLGKIIDSHIADWLHLDPPDDAQRQATAARAARDGAP